MRVAKVRLTLWLTAAVSAAGAVAALVAGTMLPLDVPSEAPPAAQSRRPSSSATTLATLPPLESFEPAWRLPLRRPAAPPAATRTPHPRRGRHQAAYFSDSPRRHHRRLATPPRHLHDRPRHNRAKRRRRNGRRGEDRRHRR